MDLATAEAIVQDAFIAVHEAWRTLPDTDAALCLLHRTVVTGSRAAPQPASAPLLPGTAQPDRELAAGGGLLGPVIVAALGALPADQREAVVLQYYAGLPYGEIAKVMGIHEDAVERLAALSAAVLRGVLNAKPARSHVGRRHAAG